MRGLLEESINVSLAKKLEWQACLFSSNFEVETNAELIVDQAFELYDLRFVRRERLPDLEDRLSVERHNRNFSPSHDSWERTPAVVIEDEDKTARMTVAEMIPLQELSEITRKTFRKPTIREHARTFFTCRMEASPFFRLDVVRRASDMVAVIQTVLACATQSDAARESSHLVIAGSHSFVFARRTQELFVLRAPPVVSRLFAWAITFRIELARD